MTEEQTDAVLDEIIFYFENCDFRAVHKRLFGDKHLSDFEKLNAIDVVTKERRKCWDMAFMLFGKWSDSLWY